MRECIECMGIWPSIVGCMVGAALFGYWLARIAHHGRMVRDLALISQGFAKLSEGYAELYKIGEAMEKEAAKKGYVLPRVPH